MFKAIIFDLDGTLIDSAQDVCHALNKLLIAHECQTIDPNHIYGYLKQGVHWLIKTSFLKSKKELNAEEIKALAETYLLNYQAEPIARTKIYPGVVDTLALFQKRGIKLSICTNKPSIMTHLVLEKLQLSSFFDAIVAADDTPLLKPYPEHIYETILKMNMELNADVVMVGDSDNDILAARKANIPVVAANYGYSGLAIAHLEPDACIDDFFSLPHVLEQIYNSIKH